jgi:hypothetical protein
MRRWILRRWALGRVTPEDRLEEWKRTQPAVAEVSVDIIRELAAICESRGGTLVTVTPQSYPTLQPGKPLAAKPGRKKLVERVVCSQSNPKWDDMKLVIYEICVTARKHILERREPFRYGVEAEFRNPSGPYVQVVDEAYPDMLNPRRIPTHKVTMRMVIDAKIRVPKEKLGKAINYLLDRPGALESIKTVRDLEREILQTLFEGLKNRVADLERIGCTPDVREEIQFLSQYLVRVESRGVADLIASKEAELRRMRPGAPEGEIRRRARGEVGRELVEMLEKDMLVRDELGRFFAEILARTAVRRDWRSLIEYILMVPPTVPLCPPKVTVDVTRGREESATTPIPIPVGAGFSYKIKEELKKLGVEIEVDQIEVRIEFCTPWCLSILCMLDKITPGYVVEELLRRAEELGFAEVKIQQL